MSKMSTSNEEVKTESQNTEIKDEGSVQSASKSTSDKILAGLKWFFTSFIWLAILLFIGDMVTKVCAEKFLAGKESIVIIPHVIQLTLVYNKGAAWGAGGDAMRSRILLCSISWIAMIGIIWALVKYWKKLNYWYRGSIMAILAGDVGNLIDRTFFFKRGVIDFLDITPMIPGFGIFNFADSCLVVGIIILIILFIIDMIKDSKANKQKAAEAEEKIKNERDK